MDADRAIAIIETILAPKSLNSVQIQVIRGVIAGRSYQEIVTAIEADEIESWSNFKPGAGRYQVSYIKETGAQLWQSLSQRLGQRVTKKSLAAILARCSKQPDVRSAVDSYVRGESMSIDWGEGVLPQLGVEIGDDRFYGRTEELATLTDWCLQARCRTISLIGMGGIGKSILAWELAHQLAGNFDRLIWRSLLNSPTLIDLCTDLLSCLSPQAELAIPDRVEAQIELLITGLKRDRCLLILDNVESILEGQVQAGQYLPCCEHYDLLFKAIGELPHQSCLLLTSREKPHTLIRTEITHPQFVRSLNIDGLEPDVAHALVQACGCPQIPTRMWQEVYAHYSGNPLALKMAAQAAVEMTGGGEAVLGLYPLMIEGKLPFQRIEDIIHRQFERLSAIEQQLVYWLAIAREPISSIELRAHLLPNPLLQGEIINALQSILRRCIAIRQSQGWTLQPVTIAYVTRRSIEIVVAELSPDPPMRMSADLLPQQFIHLNSYAIITATTKDYLRHAQVKLMLRPIVDRLLLVWGDRSALSRHLEQILSQWKSLDPIPPGYLADNILNLAIEVATDRSLSDAKLRASELQPDG